MTLKPPRVSASAHSRRVVHSIVEFSTPDEAQRAIKELSDTPLMGRQVFVREVSRLQGRRFTALPILSPAVSVVCRTAKTRRATGLLQRKVAEASAEVAAEVALVAASVAEEVTVAVLAGDMAVAMVAPHLPALLARSSTSET